MEYQNIIDPLDTTFDNVPRFSSKKWIEIDDQLGKKYNINKKDLKRKCHGLN